MKNITIEVQIPPALLRLGFDQQEIQRRIVEWVVFSRFLEGHLSSGKAARLLNMTRIEFLALLRARGLAYLHYTPDELAEEFAAVETLKVTPPS